MILHKKLKESVRVQVKTWRLKTPEKAKFWVLLPFFPREKKKALIKLLGFNNPTITARYVSLFAKKDSCVKCMRLSMKSRDSKRGLFL